jgi:hypothetical protein
MGRVRYAATDAIAFSIRERRSAARAGGDPRLRQSDLENDIGGVSALSLPLSPLSRRSGHRANIGMCRPGHRSAQAAYAKVLAPAEPGPGLDESAHQHGLGLMTLGMIEAGRAESA